MVFRVFPCGHFNSNCFSRVLHQHVLQDISCFSQTKFLFSSKEITEQGSLKCFWIEGICPDMRPYLTCSCSQCPYGQCLEQIGMWKFAYSLKFTLLCSVMSQHNGSVFVHLFHRGALSCCCYRQKTLKLMFPIVPKPLETSYLSTSSMLSRHLWGNRSPWKPGKQLCKCVYCCILTQAMSSFCCLWNKSWKCNICVSEMQSLVWDPWTFKCRFLFEL